MAELHIHGIPSTVSDAEAAILRTRLFRLVDDLRRDAALDDVSLVVTTRSNQSPTLAASANLGEPGVEERARQYVASDPLWNLDQVIAPQDLLDEVHTALDLIRLEPLVFGTWGLRDIEPFPRSALNFHGSPGTGKTMTAHAVAAALGRKILAASYAQIESKYHGDGPKNVEALFFAAERDQAVLFIDEADSLLSKRLTNVAQGSEQAINSMRSQILICLERYRGVVIFATNLVANYDQAFESRVRHIRFPMPDDAARAAIWRNHLLDTLPLAADVDAGRLAGAEAEICGRDIKNAVVSAALRVARRGDQHISQADLEGEIRRIVAARRSVRGEEYLVGGEEYLVGGEESLVGGAEGCGIEERVRATISW